MATTLDMLVLLFLAMGTLAILAVCLLFLMKNERVKTVCFYFLIVSMGKTLFIC